MTRYLFLLSLLFVFFVSRAQNFEWAAKFGEGVGPILTDPQGNIFVSGGFRGTVDFDPGPAEYNLTATSPISAFIIKISPTGTLIWAKKIDSSRGAALLAMDSRQNLYMVGTFVGTVDLDPGPGTHSLTSSGDNDIYIGMLDSTGSFTDAKQIGGTNRELLSAISMDASDNLYLTGFYTGTADFDPGPGTFLQTSTLGTGFFLKLDSSLNLAWAKQFEESAGTMDICADQNGNVFISGSFSGSVDFDPGPGNHQLTTIAGSTDGFIVKVSPSGEFVWVKLFGGNGTSSVSQISIGSGGEIIFTGLFWGNVDLDPGPDELSFNTVQNQSSSQDIFIGKLDSQGNLVWGKRIGNELKDTPGGLYVDADDYLYFGGSYEGSVDIDPGPGIHILPGDYTSCFILKLSPAGNFSWAKNISSSTQDHLVGGASLAVDSWRNVYTGGYFTGNINFNTDSAGIYTLSTANPYTMGGFLQKMTEGPCNMTLAIDSISILPCNGPGYISLHAENGSLPYTYNWNNSATASDSVFMPVSPGIHRVTVSDRMGCVRRSAFLLTGPIDSTGFDLDANLVAGDFRPGFSSLIRLDAINNGCLPASGTLSLVLDSLLAYDTADPLPDIISGDTLTWNFTDSRFSSAHIIPQITVQVAETAAIGDSVSLWIFVLPEAGDAHPDDNRKLYRFPVVNGYDPNDKQVYPKGECIPGYITSDQKLTYTIRFQNTGNAEAVNIHVIDSLSPGLDISTVRILGQSHPMYTKVLSDRTLDFIFDNIWLPDSSSDEPGSHGYVIFEARPLAGLPLGTEIKNKSAIYFDFNPPILTNTVKNTLSDGNLGVRNTVSTQSVCGTYTWNGQTYTASGAYVQRFQNIFGCDSTVTLQLTINSVDASATQTGFTLTANATGAAYQWIDCENSSLLPGFVSQSFTPQTEGNYAVRVTQNGCADTSACFFVAGMGVGNNAPVFLSLYPNPAENMLQLSITGDGFDRALLRIIGSTGQVLREETVSGQTVTVDVSAYPAGIYLAEVLQHGKYERIRWIKR